MEGKKNSDFRAGNLFKHPKAMMHGCNNILAKKF